MSALVPIGAESKTKRLSIQPEGQMSACGIDHSVSEHVVDFYKLLRFGPAPPLLLRSRRQSRTVGLLEVNGLTRLGCQSLQKPLKVIATHAHALLVTTFTPLISLADLLSPSWARRRSGGVEVSRLRPWCEARAGRCAAPAARQGVSYGHVRICHESGPASPVLPPPDRWVTLPDRPAQGADRSPRMPFKQRLRRIRPVKTSTA